MLAPSPSPCLIHGVTRLCQTAEYLDAVNGFRHVASISPASRCGRHTGGITAAEHPRTADLSYAVVNGLVDWFVERVYFAVNVSLHAYKSSFLPSPPLV